MKQMFNCRAVVVLWVCISVTTILFPTGNVMANVMTLTFEELLGQDGTPIGTFYPGVRFEALSTGEDWIVSDVTTDAYNTSSWSSGQRWGNGEYWIYDYVAAWTGQPGDGGKIIFEYGGVSFVELGYCAGSSLTLSAYDAGNNEIDSDSGPANRRYMETNGSGPGTLRVDAPSGKLISYVIIHDSGNFWIIDNITVGTALDFMKIDDVENEDCRSLDDEVTYTISWDYPGDYPFENVCLIDRLPADATFLYELIDGQPVEYPEAVFDPNLIWQWLNDPNFVWPQPEPLPAEAGIYDPQTHTITWFLNILSQGSSGSVSFKIRINNRSIPGGKLHNIAELWYDETLLVQDTEDTSVCCWDTTGIIYTDAAAPDGGNGTSWAMAFNNLDDALERARTTTQCSGSFSIFCAQGTYTPQDTENGFVLPSGCSVLGGFKSGGDYADRNPKKYETILTGLLDEETIADRVVTMGHETLLDGFVVTNAFSHNIYGSGVDFTIARCTIKDCFFGNGINAVNGNINVQWTTVNSNGTDGLYHRGAGYSAVVSNSWLLRNGEHGIQMIGSTLDLKNSIVSESDMMRWGRPGVRLYRPMHQPRIYNATIANNKAAGIYFESSNDPNNPIVPDLQNSILYFNNNNDSQVTGFNPDLYANFCCIQDCNTIGTTNFNDQPGFAYMILDPNGMPDPTGIPDPNNYHLAANSVCIDRGNPFLDYSMQVDIDGEGLDRKYGEYVDVGADEVYNCDDEYVSEADVYNELDWNADGIVNWVEFRAFSAAWLSHSGQDPAWLADPNLVDPNLIAAWNPMCNLADMGTSQYVIDLADLEIFLEDWLWVACWKMEEINAMIAMMAGGDQQMQGLAAGFIGTNAVQTVSEPKIVQPEPTVEEQILRLQQTLVFLGQIWFENPQIQREIDAETWQEFMGAVYQNLLELQSGTIQIE
jgi:hypothetical protein